MSFRRRLKPSAEFSSSSIADLVFLLLIFFMLTSSFITQAGVRVDLPTSDSEKPSPGSNTITISEKGTYYWNTRELGKGKEIEEKEMELKQKIREVLEDEDETNNVITLRVDQKVNHGQTMVVFAEVAGLGGSIVIQTEKK